MQTLSQKLITKHQFGQTENLRVKKISAVKMSLR